MAMVSRGLALEEVEATQWHGRGRRGGRDYGAEFSSRGSRGCGGYEESETMVGEEEEEEEANINPHEPFAAEQQLPQQFSRLDISTAPSNPHPPSFYLARPR